MRRSSFGNFDEMFERMARQLDEMNRQFDSWSPAMSREEYAGSGMTIDVADHGSELVVTADVPGFEREDIDVTVNERTLTIRAERDVESSEGESGEYLRRERRHESMRRTIRLPVDVDESAASASYTNGVLSVTLPKIEVSEDSHRIDVN